MTIDQYIGASGIVYKYQLPKKTRMKGVVSRCINAVEICFSVSYDDLKSNKHNAVTVLAKYAAIRLLGESTNLSYREIEKIFGMSASHSNKLRDIFNGQAPAVQAMYDKLVQYYYGVVQEEYDENIPF